MTDSEQVPWGKGEKYLFIRDEIESEIEYLSVIIPQFNLWYCTFCIMGQQECIYSKLNALVVGLVKARNNRFRIVICILPEVEWSSHDQVELLVNR
jgi:hypothetical protein